MTIERPVATVSNLAPEWGSDVIALALRNLGVRYVSLNPGASYRGLHDSLVNFLGNEMPQMVLCLHEEHAVAVAHGYAKVTGEAMAVALHSNVGLMHATMAIFDAWCDRAPVILLGATGPVDAARRRPWIDWIHTARDQGALIRNFTKWDDQPASPEAAVESLYRAGLIARTAPRGPVYVCFDVSLQEMRLPAPLVPPDPSRFAAGAPPRPAAEAVAEAAAILLVAKHPLILAGRVSRDRAEWDARVELAERLGANVLTDRKAAAAFPTDHALHAAPPVTFMTPEVAEVMRRADAILALDWIDLAGTLSGAWPDGPPVPVIHASVDQYSHNGWSMDHQGLPPSMSRCRRCGCRRHWCRPTRHDLQPERRRARRLKRLRRLRRYSLRQNIRSSWRGVCRATAPNGTRALNWPNGLAPTCSPTAKRRLPFPPTTRCTPPRR